MLAVQFALVGAALTLALALRPWRLHPDAGPPWPSLAITCALPLLWGLDRYTAPLAQPLSGAALLVLFAGWPWAVLACVPAAAVTAWLGGLDLSEALHRLVGLGLVPATLTVGIGAALRRLLPHHLFVYILGRGFVGTIVVCAAAHALDLALHPPRGGLSAGDRWLAGVLGAFAEGTMTGMLIAIAVAFRPHWLATYSDRLYLPPRSRG